jgi:signal transduction histidine kinase
MPRPFNRIVKEANLETKCLLFFGAALIVVISFTFFLYWKVTDKLVREQNPLTANLWAQQYLMEKHWEAFGQRTENDTPPPPTVLQPTNPVPTTSEESDFRRRMEEITKRIRIQKPDIQFIANPDKIQEIYFGVKNNETAESRKKRIENDWNDYTTAVKNRDIRDFPVFHPDFQSGEKPKTTDQLDENGVYYYFEEVRLDRESDCATCHLNFSHGELMGVVKVTIGESSMKQTLQRYWAYMIASAIVSAFLALLAAYFVIHFVVIKPIRSLQEVTQSITNGDHSKRADIKTDDEFQVLGEAFNRMITNLVNSQHELKKKKDELDGMVDKLSAATLQLYEANEVNREFMATMSHELRTPLNSIIGFSDVLASVSTLSDKQKRYVEIISKSGQTLLTMINDILDVSKMEAGLMETKPSEFNIAWIVNAQTDMAKPLLDRKNISLETHIEENLPMVWQDESRIQQILNNLLSNAIKFTPVGGRITVSVQKEQEDFLLLQVSDTGVGIKEEDQEIIFEKFRQGENTKADGDALKREYSGSGLGLSIVRGICKLLGGEISLKSQWGIGSTFTVKLPWQLEVKPKYHSDMEKDVRQFAQNRIAKHQAVN